MKPPVEMSSTEESQQMLNVITSKPPSESEVAAAAESTIVAQIELAAESRGLEVQASVEHCELLLTRPSRGQLLAADIAQQVTAAIDVATPEMPGLQSASAAEAGLSGEGASVDHREWTTRVPAGRCVVYSVNC